MSSMSLNLGGLRTSVVIHGCEAVQFGTEINVSKSRASSWMISGDENTPFCIYTSLENLPEQDNYVIRVYLDDVQVGKTIVREGRPRGCYFSTVRISEMETRQFMFGRLKLSDEEAMRQPPWTESTGTIKVTLTRALNIGPSRASFHAYAVQPERVPEVNGSSTTFHCIQYARSQLDAERRGALYFRVKDEVLLSTHIIRYRPMSMLQKHGIVPYQPPPVDGYSTPMMPPNAPPPHASSYSAHDPHSAHTTHTSHSESASPALPPSKKRRVIDPALDPDGDDEDEDQQATGSTPRKSPGAPEKKIKLDDD